MSIYQIPEINPFYFSDGPDAIKTFNRKIYRQDVS